jgi:hypothetical protein
LGGAARGGVESDLRCMSFGDSFDENDQSWYRFRPIYVHEALGISIFSRSSSGEVGGRLNL